MYALHMESIIFLTALSSSTCKVSPFAIAKYLVSAELLMLMHAYFVNLWILEGLLRTYMLPYVIKQGR